MIIVGNDKYKVNSAANIVVRFNVLKGCLLYFYFYFYYLFHIECVLIVVHMDDNEHALMSVEVPGAVALTCRPV